MKFTTKLSAFSVFTMLLCSPVASAQERTELISDVTNALAVSAGRVEGSSVTVNVANESTATQAASSQPGDRSLKSVLNRGSKASKKTAKRGLKESVGLKSHDSSAGYITVGIALLLLAGVGFWLKRRGAAGGKSVKSPTIETIASTRIAGKHLVSLVRVPGRVLVVGVGENGFNLLTELDETDLAESGENRTAERQDTEDTFITRLMGLDSAGQPEVAPSDPFGLAMADVAPADELLKRDERHAIRERLQGLRQRRAAHGLHANVI